MITGKTCTKLPVFLQDDFMLFNDDCFNVFDVIPDKSVDLVFLDLPYNITKNS